MVKKLIQLTILGALLMGSNVLKAQVIMELGGTPEEFANLINGNGVQILNPSITCADSAFGQYIFVDVANLPTARGVVLSTGNIFDAPGPNLSSTTTTEWGTPGDDQITTIAGQSSFDACVFEFDVVPVGDTLRFNFTFASEEYPEYVGTPFNDVFAFLISGPGITGDVGLDGFENIALIPGTSTPVGINTVNNGNPDIGFPAVNSDFFVSNPIGFSTQFEYDGFTTGLFAQKVLAACDTFRLKLVIADVGDERWDSSVFIESIESNNVSLTATTDGEIENMIEGCNFGTVTFTRAPVSSAPLNVTYFIGGTAINGVDYPAIGDPDPSEPKFITIPAGEASATVTIEPIDDGLNEGLETVVFYIGNPLCPGTVQDSLVFGILDELEIAVDPPQAFICPGESYTFNVIGEGNNFNWSPIDFLDDPTIKEPTASPDENTIYTITSIVSSCEETATGEVRVSNIVLTPDVTDIACGGDDNGAITLGVSGGESPFEFEWTGPDGFSSDSQNLSNLAPGTYSVLVTDREGCTQTTEVTIDENPPLEITVSSPEFLGGNNVSCNNAADGQATVSIEGGTAPFTIAWDDAAAQSNTTASGLTAGTYNVTVTDANACVSTASITLTQPEPITGTLENRDDVLCFGESTGNLTILGVGGTAPYTYVWNTVPPQTGPDASGIPAGIYTVTITDVNGCVGFAEAQIQQPAAALSGNVLVTPPSCNGFNDGSALAEIEGGTAPYTYLWSSAPGNNTANLEGLAAGSYNLTVTDDNGCSISLPFNVTAPLPLAVNVVSLVNVLCNGEATGSVTVNATGGTGPFTYTWNTTPATDGASLQNVEAGLYSVEVVDANGCAETLEIEIEEPEVALSLSVSSASDPSCDAFENGSIAVEAAGGTAPYTYTWNTTPPATGSELNGLPEGSYTVTVTDANGCSFIETIELTAPEPLVLEITTQQNILCSGAETGSIAVDVSGGTAPYEYLWDDALAQDTPTAQDLGAGAYTLTVTDANGCIATVQATLTEPALPLGVDLINSENVLCFGDNSGLIQVVGTGGSGSYNYQWDDPANQTGPIASGLAPGTYTVTVLDNNGCELPVTLEVIIDGPESALALEITPSLFTGGVNVACADDSTATLDLTITGGTAPYDVLWNLPGLDTSTDLNLIDLAPGVYSVTVTDANGCVEESSITLTAPEPIEITSSSTPSLCFGSPEGSISIEIFGGTPTYEANWTGPGGFTGTGLELTNLEGGVYLLTVEDANGCILLDAVTVIQPEDLTITVDSISDINGFNTSCWNSSDGSIFITPGGGITPYSYIWNRPGNPNFSNQQDVSNLSAGTYEVVLTDQNGCVQNEFIELIGPDPISIDFIADEFDNGFNISCNGEADGSITAVASGGTPGYNFIWIGTGGFGPVFGNPIENVSAGEYSVLIQDANNCTFSSSFSITEPPAYSINLFAESINGNNITCAGANDGSIILTISGNTGPYTFAWTGPDGYSSTLQNPVDLAEGEYCVDVTDSNDCTESACITLTAPLPLTLTLEPFVYPNGGNISCGGANDGSISTIVEGGTAPVSYTWTGPGNFSSNAQNISTLVEGTYCLTITDANGCQSTECAELIAAPSIEIALTIDSPILCEGDGNADVLSTVTGGTAPLNFEWTGPDGFTADTEEILGVGTGTYCLTVTDADGCSEQTCITVNAPPAISIALTPSTFSGGFGLPCSDSDDGFVLSTVSGGTAPLSYFWTGPDGFESTSQNIENLQSGTYCLEVTDANGCTVTECSTLEAPEPLVATGDVVLPACNDGSGAEVTVTPSGGTPPYTFNWSNGASTGNVNLIEGNYIVLVMDANECILFIPFSISLPNALTVSLQSPQLPGGANVACNGDFGGIINTTISGGQGDLTFSWDGPDGFISDQADLSGLQAGAYCLTVTDEEGCTGEACITLTEPEALSLAFEGTQPICPGEANASLTAVVTGGVPTFAIAWTGPDGFTANGASLSSLTAGTYCATVTDLNGCITNACFDIVDPASFDIVLTSPEEGGVNIACFGGNTGSITTTVSGNIDDLSFIWIGPNGFAAEAINLENLLAGEYCLTVSNNSGCEEQACIVLTEPDGLDITFDVNTLANGFNTSCSDACDGSLSVNLSGGVAPIALSWNGPDGFTSTDASLSNLCPGTYTLTTTDANACVQTADVEISAPETIELNINSPAFPGGTEISCFNDNNGVINTAVTGGLGDFTYSWSGPNGFVSDQASLDELEPGTYTVLVTDGTGCIAEESITLTQPEAPLSGTATTSEFASGDNISCTGLADGSIETIAIGGTGPYLYNWLGPNEFNSGSANLENLEPGAYTLVIEDVNSCVFTINVTLTEPELPLAVEVVETLEPECFDSETGSISLSASGGSPGYEITWIGPNDFSSNEFNIENLTSGTYFYVVTDINGCNESGNIDLSAPLEIAISAEVVPASCDAQNGIVNTVLAGGTPPYSVLWSNGAETQNLIDVGQGSYTITVTDDNGCVAEASFEVLSQNDLSFESEIAEPTCFGDGDGTLSLSTLTGAEPITYMWEGPNGFTASAGSLTELVAGDYTLTAVDANGCVVEETYTVTQPDAVVISELVSPLYPNGFNLTAFQSEDGVINAPEVSGGNSPYSFNWTGPNNFASQTPGALGGLEAGTYFLMVVDANSCSDSASIVLIEPVPLELPNGISPNGDGFNDGLIVRGLEDFPNNKLMVYNRWGNLLYEETNYRNATPWQGLNESGEQLPQGTYFVIVELQGRDSLRGYLELRR